jgi:hypothetical protein
MVLEHLLPSVRPQSFLEWTHARVEPSLEDFAFSILLEERVEVGLEMLEVGNCPHTLVSKTDRSGPMMFKYCGCVDQGRC